MINMGEHAGQIPLLIIIPKDTEQRLQTYVQCGQ
jgi:hypothetical protein